MTTKILKFLSIVIFLSASFSLNAQTNVVPDDVEFQALKALYDSLGGSNWTTKTNWPNQGNWPATATAAQMGTWYGVTVTNGDVSSLTLNQNNLSGILPKTLTNLIRLTNLSLQTNNISGTIPSSIQNLADLNLLYLHGNKLSGLLPTEIGSLTKLTRMWIYANMFSGNIPASINNLTNLNELYLNDNPLFTGDIPNLSNLTKLKAFSLGNCTQLNAGPIPAWSLTLNTLTILNLYNCKRTGIIPSELGNLANLTQLQLYSNSLTGVIPPSLGNLSKLTNLYLYSNSLTGIIPSSLGSLSNLQYLYLFSNQLTGSIPSELGNISSLLYLNLSANKLTGNIPSSLGKLSKLLQLILSVNKLTGNIPPEIGGLTKLTQIFVNNNQLSGTLPSSIGNLTNLTHLYLYINELSGELPSTLGNLTKLQYFYANSNQFIGTLPTTLSNWTQISLFYVSGNKLSGQLPDNFFSTWSNLGLLNLDGNNFSGAFPSSIGSCVLLSYLTSNKNNFTSLPSTLLNLPVAAAIQFESNELTSIPNFTLQVNKVNLQLMLGYNRLDFSQLEPLVGSGIKTLTTLVQKNIQDIPTQSLVINSDFILTARPKGPFTSNIKWEKLQPNGVTWLDVSSSNADPVTGTTYRIVNASSSAEGKYRWSCTSTKVTGFTLSSDPIEVKTPERFTIDNLAFQYKYDGRKRMISKRVPGAEWVYMVYDDRDRLVLTQDAEQRKLNKWSFTKYDVLNRPIITGIYTHASYLDQAGMSALISTVNFSETYNADPFNHGYSNVVFPLLSITNSDVMSVTYYDNYNFNSDQTFSYRSTELSDQYTYVNGSAFPRVNGQVTGTKIKVIDGVPYWIKTVNYYDDKYRVIQTISDNHLNGLQVVTNTYDFVGKVLKSKETLINRNPTWQNVVGTKITSNGLIKTAVNGWGNAGASSIEIIPANTDGWLEVTMSETTLNRMVGLSDQDTDQNITSMDFAIYQQQPNYYVYENVVYKKTIYEPSNPNANSNKVRVGDVMRIQRVGSVIKYYWNDFLLYTSTTPSTSTLMIDAALNNVNSTLLNVRSSFSDKVISSITRTFNYDHAGRLLKTWHSVNGATPVLLAQNEYNELGQLVDKKLYSTDNGSNFKQSVDYRYNIRGWLTSINNGQLITDNTNDDSNDLFGMNLHYNDLVSGLTTTSDAQYNGNISAIQYSNNQALGTVKSHGYKFGYDPMNRLLSATHKERTGTWNASGSYHEDNLSYDLNGNIKSLSRRGENASVMDILSYDYGAGSSASNKLLSVSDTGDKTKGFIDGNIVGDDYTYDANGNMVIDKNKSIITSAGAAGITYNYLNLPEKVVKSNGDYIKYVYDASGRKLSQGVYNSANVLKKKTDYVGEYFYENDTLKFINHEEGRVVMTSLSPGEGQGEAEYQYNMKDHLGNVRMTFTTKDDIQVSTATLETANVASEQGKFLNYDEAIKINSLWFDHSHRIAGGASNTTQYATRLTGGNTNATIGLAKSLSVMPGDKIDVEVFAKYLDPNPNNLSQALKDFITSIATGGGAPGGTIIDGGFAGSLGNNVFPFAGFFTHSSESSASPKAYLNYLVFDRNYVFKTGGFKRVTTAAIETGANGLHERLYFDGVDQIKITEPGYVYIWLSNENETAVEVYFDDFKVTHTKSPVIATNDYYPFGLTFNSYQRENSTPQDYKFNNMEIQSELGLNWLDFGARMYQPELGRMNSIDPHYFNYFETSPYAFVLNNPILFSDPTGMDTTKTALVNPPSLPAPPPPATVTPPPATVTPPAINPLPFFIPSTGSLLAIISLAFVMQGDTPKFDYFRFIELQDKEDTGNLKEDERQELENMRKKENNPYLKKTDAQLQKDKKSYEDLIQEHLEKIDRTKCDPESYFGDRLKGLTPEQRQEKIDGRVNALNRQLNRQARELIQIKETIKKREN
jgi:RHS repeat-associated protein